MVFFYSNLNRLLCKQTVENVASDLILNCVPMSHKKDNSLTLYSILVYLLDGYQYIPDTG